MGNHATRRMARRRRVLANALIESGLLDAAGVPESDAVKIAVDLDVRLMRRGYQVVGFATNEEDWIE